jgi:hypothetical protein
MNEDLEAKKARRQYINEVYPFPTPRELDAGEYHKKFLTRMFFSCDDALKERELTRRELYCQRCLSRKRGGTLGGVRVFVSYETDILDAFPNVVETRCEKCGAKETAMMDLAPGGYRSFNELSMAGTSVGNTANPFLSGYEVSEKLHEIFTKKYPFIRGSLHELAVPKTLIEEVHKEVSARKMAQRQQGKSQMLGSMYGLNSPMNIGLNVYGAGGAGGQALTNSMLGQIAQSVKPPAKTASEIRDEYAALNNAFLSGIGDDSMKKTMIDRLRDLYKRGGQL